MHVREDETHSTNTTQYIIATINDAGAITYNFDLVLNSHNVLSVNERVGEVVIGMDDISGLQEAINGAKFNGNLSGNLSVGGTSILKGTTINENLNVNGTTTLKGTTMNGDLNVSGGIFAGGVVLANGPKPPTLGTSIFEV